QPSCPAHLDAPERGVHTASKCNRQRARTAPTSHARILNTLWLHQDSCVVRALERLIEGDADKNVNSIRPHLAIITLLNYLTCLQDVLPTEYQGDFAVRGHFNLNPLLKLFLES